MLPRLLYWRDRLSHPRSRAEQLRDLRTRLAATPNPTPKARHIALQMQQLRQAIFAATGAVEACSQCATGCPMPHGRWNGGFCCSGETHAIFSPTELAALHASGTRPASLQPPPPATDHAGCAFRGPRGCSLPVQHRPNLCVTYICRDLSKELALRGDFEAIDAMCEELKALLEEFAAALG